MKQYIDILSTMFTSPKIDITSYQKGSIFKDGKEEKISSTISGLKDKIDSPKDNPLMIMLKKLKEKQQANVETVVRNDNHKNIRKQVTANDPSLTTLQKEAVNGKNKIHRDIRVINGRLYNVKDIKKLKEFDIADEVVTDPSDIDFIGGRYTVYANKQIIRTYIANGEIRIEEVDKIPESRSRGNAKRILDGEVVSTTENIILEYSGIYDGYRAVTGKDPETSQNISSTDQALSAASIIPITKIVKVGKYVFRLDQGKNVKRVKTPTYGKQSVPKGPYREVNGFPAKVKSGAQEKHIPETPNYKQEVANGKKKSIFYGDNKKAQELLDKYAGKGEFLKNGREVIDFGQKIGKTYDMKTDKYIETTRGTIHYSKDGAHIVPAKPLE